MSLCRESYQRCANVALALALVAIALPCFLNAQTTPPPKASAAQSDDIVPKWELFLGYQWVNPGGNIPDTSTSPPTEMKLKSMSKGGGANISYNFTKYIAGEINYGGNWADQANEQAFSLGPKFTYRGDGVNFFAHTLISLNRLTPGNGVDASNGVGALLGGGMDLRLWKQVSLRLFEADFEWAHHNFTSVVPFYLPGARPELDGARLTTGLVFNFGGAPEAPVGASCSVQPTEVMVGEPVHATVVPSNFNAKHKLTYSWTSNAGKVQGNDANATIDTNGVSGGSYTTTATVTDPKAKKNNTASCTANFSVKEPPKNPPQMSCSASPTTIKPGETASITCSCTSPDNVPVTVAGWTASAGSITGSGNNGTLNTTGASSGAITINATCTDSRGLTASATSTVTVENPPPPPPPQATKVNECQYPNVKKPWRVDNTCKAELDDVALKLQQDPDAKLVVVGNAAPNEKRKNLAGERALNVKAYISGGEAKQNIDPSRIEARVGNEGTATTEQWIVPAGATFPEADSTTPVDEKKVKAVPDHPKPMARKKAKKAQ
jgi:hypothetical protein